MADPRNKNDIEIGMTVKIAKRKKDLPDKWMLATVVEILSSEDYSPDGVEVMIHDGSDGYCKEIVEGFVPISEEELDALIQNHETVDFELKSSFKWSMKNNKIEDCLGEQVVKAVGAFMNTKGGKICIGVDDARNVIGLENELSIAAKKDNVKEDAFKQHIRAFITSRIELSTVDTLFDSYIMLYKGKQVCIIDVKKSDKGVFVLEKYKAHTCDSKNVRNTSRWVFYVRTGQGTKSYSPYEAREHWMRTRKTDFL